MKLKILTLFYFIFKMSDIKLGDDLFWKQGTYLSLKTAWFLLDTISRCRIIKTIIIYFP